AAPLAKGRPIEEQLIDLVGARAFYAIDQVPRDAESFEAQRLVGRRSILPAVQEVTKIVGPLFDAYHDLRSAIEQPRPPTWQYALDDIRDQLARLLLEDFLTTTPWNWLQHYPRFLKALTTRLKKIVTSGLARDRQSHDIVAPRWQAYKERADDHRRRLI